MKKKIKKNVTYVNVYMVTMPYTSERRIQEITRAASSDAKRRVRGKTKAARYDADIVARGIQRAARELGVNKNYTFKKRDRKWNSKKYMQARLNSLIKTRDLDKFISKQTQADLAGLDVPDWIVDENKTGSKWPRFSRRGSNTNATKKGTQEGLQCTIEFL